MKPRVVEKSLDADKPLQLKSRFVGNTSHRKLVERWVELDHRLSSQAGALMLQL